MPYAIKQFTYQYMYLHKDRWFRRRLGFRLQRLKEFLFGSGESRSNKSCSHPFGKANSWTHPKASCFVRSVSVLKAILSTPVVFPFLAYTHHIHQLLHYRFVSLEWINKLRIFGWIAGANGRKHLEPGFRRLPKHTACHCSASTSPGPHGENNAGSICFKERTCPQTQFSSKRTLQTTILDSSTNPPPNHFLSIRNSRKSMNYINQ